jgi:hypothetical protein
MRGFEPMRRRRATPQHGARRAAPPARGGGPPTKAHPQVQIRMRRERLRLRLLQPSQRKSNQVKPSQITSTTQHNWPGPHRPLCTVEPLIRTQPRFFATKPPLRHASVPGARARAAPGPLFPARVVATFFCSPGSRRTPLRKARPRPPVFMPPARGPTALAGALLAFGLPPVPASTAPPDGMAFGVVRAPSRPDGRPGARAAPHCSAHYTALAPSPWPPSTLPEARPAPFALAPACRSQNGHGSSSAPSLLHGQLSSDRRPPALPTTAAPLIVHVPSWPCPA